MASSHTADAAGGEAIYSSDGLSPLPIPPPPSSTTAASRRKDGTENDTLDSESTNPIQAFEVFSGKLFPPPTRNKIGSSAGVVTTTPTAVGESRLARLARIQAELEELEAEDDNLNASIVDKNDQEELAIRGVVKDLSDKLRILQSGADMTRRQTHLTTMVNNLEIKEQGGFPPKDSSSKQEGLGQSMTHEQRLLRIEKAMGSQISAITCGGPDTSILERLKQAEAKLNSVDEKTLNQAASRAKVIRADLEAAAKARSKINNTNVEDTAKITKLHNQLVDMEGFLSSNILSTIVDRLATCATLHSQSMDFGKDLRALEDTVKDVEITLASVEESMKSVESGLVENMKMIQKNMEKLDQN